MNIKSKIIFWKEPNRSNAAHLHIASRGQRLSTLTGVSWIDEYRFVVNHQVGMRIAIFDIRAKSNPILIADVPHSSDSVASRKINDNTWEIVVSGCWDAVSSTYQFVDDEKKFFLLDTKISSDKSFCHGVSFGKSEKLCFAFHTGKSPRIQIGERSWKLPAPWGPRDVCYDQKLDSYFVVAVSHSANINPYKTASTSIWRLDFEEDEWKMIRQINNLHSDSCQTYKDILWFPDQLGDRVMALNLKNKDQNMILNGVTFNFPHGIAISPLGMLAVTNYGNSSISIIDISEITTRN